MIQGPLISRKGCRKIHSFGVYSGYYYRSGPFQARCLYCLETMENTFISTYIT